MSGIVSLTAEQLKELQKLAPNLTVDQIQAWYQLMAAQQQRFDFINDLPNAVTLVGFSRESMGRLKLEQATHDLNVEAATTAFANSAPMKSVVPVTSMVDDKLTIPVQTIPVVATTLLPAVVAPVQYATNSTTSSLVTAGSELAQHTSEENTAKVTDANKAFTSTTSGSSKS